MDFETYKSLFLKKAKEENKDDLYIEKCLNYAKKLSDRNIPIIYNQEHFSRLVGIQLEFLLKICNSQKNYYRSYKIPKSNGKKRLISEPLPMLKMVQKYILENILVKIPCNKCSKAYIKGVSLKDNAKFHRRQKYIVKIDLKDYFGTLKSNRVYEFFINLGYAKDVSVLLCNLCTLNYSLPQGAPTSPYLSNLLTIKLDEDLFNYCRQGKNLRYSRYADDITISGDFDPKSVIKDVILIIKSNGLFVNYDKIAVIGQNKRQEVTGIVVNQKMQVSKSYRKKIRQEIYYIKKFGIATHMKSQHLSYPEDLKMYLENLQGRINYCLSINKNDLEMYSYKQFVIKNLKYEYI